MSQKGNYPTAQEELAEQIEYYVARGDRHGEAGNLNRAVAEYKKAAALAPQDAGHWRRLAETYAAADKPQQALQYYRKIIAADSDINAPLPEDVIEAHLGLGDMCASFAMSAAAVRSYERAVRSRPKKPFYRWKLATALTTLGMYEKAEKQLSKVVELAPDDAFYRFSHADILLMMRRDDEAIRELKKVVKMAKRDDYYHLRLGAALLRNNRTSEALPYFERAVTLKKDNASHRVLLQYARQRNDENEADHADIAAEVDSIELHPYDADYVHRFKVLSRPLP